MEAFSDAARYEGLPAWYGKCVIAFKGAKPRPDTINVEHLAQDIHLTEQELEMVRLILS